MSSEPVGPPPDLRSGLLRTVMGEGIWRERARLHDVVARRLQALNARDPRRALLRSMLDDEFALPPDHGPYTDLISTTNGLLDSVEVGYEPGDTMPIRLVTYDGADDTVAYAYLTVEAAEDVVEGLTLGIRRARTPEETAAREALQAEEDARG